jgi:hypothetical protein
MVGAAIQQHGYAPTPLPPNFLQQANGYPRNCEMTNLWFVIFTDRKLIEAANCFAAIPLVLSTFLIARRYGPDRVAAMGWGAAILLMPGAALELRSTYIDLHVAAFHMAAVHLCTRPRMRIRDGAAAVLALALLLGSKSLALAWVPPLSVLALVLVLRSQGPKRMGAVFGLVGGAACALALMASLTYWRNWVHFKNPFWPVTLHVERLHLQFPGLGDLSDINYKRPLLDIWKDIASIPVPGKDFADTRVFGYGLAVPFLLLPLGGVGAVAALVFWVRRQLGHIWPREQAEDPLNTGNLILVVIYMLFTAYVSPQLWQARYNLQLAAGFMFSIQWLSAVGGRHRLASEAAAFSAVVFLVNLWWVSPGWGMDIKAALSFANQPNVVRAQIAPDEWAIEPEVAAAREREQGPGAVLAFSDDVTFPGVLWNDRFSNILTYVPMKGTGAEQLAAVEASGATWAVSSGGSPLFQALSAATSTWERIGLASRGMPTTAFRRKRP